MRDLLPFTALLLILELGLGAVVSERDVRAWSPLVLLPGGTNP